MLVILTLAGCQEPERKAVAMPIDLLTCPDRVIPTPALPPLVTPEVLRRYYLMERAAHQATEQALTLCSRRSMEAVRVLSADRQTR